MQDTELRLQRGSLINVVWQDFVSFSRDEGTCDGQLDIKYQELERTMYAPLGDSAAEVIVQ